MREGSVSCFPRAPLNEREQDNLEEKKKRGNGSRLIGLIGVLPPFLQTAAKTFVRQVLLIRQEVRKSHL